jgi:RNA-binding protein
MNDSSSSDPRAMAPHRRKALRARAHALDPVVMIGEAGLSRGVLAELDRSLKSHELIKVRVLGADRHAREALLAEICARAGAQPVQHIGRVLVIFRENPDLESRRSDAKLRAPRVPRAPEQRKRPGAQEDKRRNARHSGPKTSVPRHPPHPPASRRKSRRGLTRT